MRVHQITKHTGWAEYKTITSSNTALGVTERKNANIPADAFLVPEAMNNMEMRFKATGVDGVAGTAHVYGARENDDVCHIGDAAITAGLQLATDNNRYIDTIILTDKWITEVKKADADGNDGLSRIAFDVSGYDLVFVTITYTDTTNWIVEISGF